MTTMKRLLVLAGLALVALSAAASSATAATGIIIRPGEIFGTRSLGEISFTGGTTTISCRLSMAGQFTTVLVEIGAQIGHLEGFFLNCLNGGGFIEEFLNLPWPITVFKINDLAPTSVPAEQATTMQLSMRGAAVRISRFGRAVNCLYGAPEATFTVRSPVTRTGGTKEYRLGLLTIRETNRPTEARYALASGEANCPSEVTVRGVFEGPSGEAQTITLL